MMGLGMGFGWIFGLVILGLVFWLIMEYMDASKPHTSKNNNEALEILRKRYAKGEINHNQYEQSKKDLQN